MKIKELFKKILYPERCTSNALIKSLQKRGAFIGSGTVFFDSIGTKIDVQYPWLIHIGCNCQFSGKITIMTHDYSWCVIKAKSGEILGCSGYVIIGDNVFVGYGSTLLKGTNIGDGSIIGAGSIVSGTIPSGEVWGGSPARYICKIDEYQKRREAKQIEEAFKLYLAYVKSFGKEPGEQVFLEYISLFVDLSNSANTKKYLSRLRLMNNYDKTIEFYKNKNHYLILFHP